MRIFLKVVGWVLAIPLTILDIINIYDALTFPKTDPNYESAILAFAIMTPILIIAWLMAFGLIGKRNVKQAK